MNAGGAGHSLFVYWKIEPARAAAALVAVRECQARLRAAHPGLQTGLYQRSDGTAATEGRVTCMETYAAQGGVGIGLLSAIEVAATAALQPLGAPQRHVEMFEAVDG